MCIHICIYLCMYVYMYVYINIYVYIYRVNPSFCRFSFRWDPASRLNPSLYHKFTQLTAPPAVFYFLDC